MHCLRNIKVCNLLIVFNILKNLIILDKLSDSETVLKFHIILSLGEHYIPTNNTQTKHLFNNDV